MSAQSVGPLSHQAWSTEEGLPASSVHQILQSRDGYIWLATEGGAVRFDGATFTTFRHENEPALASNDIIAIAEDEAGNLWFGTSDGLVELHSGTFTQMSNREGFAATGVLALAAPGDGSLLALTNGGLLRFDGKSFQPMVSGTGDITVLEASPDGTVRVLGESGVTRYHNGRFVPQGIPFASAEALSGLQYGTDGVVWARTARSIFEVGAGVRRKWQAGKELRTGRITTLLVDRNGFAWIGTTHGLFTIAQGQGSAPAAVDPLRGEAIASLFEDREGNLWVGTEGSGLHVLRPRTFRSEVAAAGEAVTAVVTASDGTTWFGTRGDGLHSISAKGLQTPAAAASLTSSIILSLARGMHGDVWAGTPDGLNHVDGKKVEQFTSATGLPDDFVRSVAVDAQGVVWAGTRLGLAKVEHGQVTTLTTEDGLGSDSIGPLLEVPAAVASKEISGLWAGTSAGLSQLVGSQIRNYATSLPAGRSIVTAIASDGRKGLWVGLHQGGLAHFEGGTFVHAVAPSLPDEIVAILLDSRGFLWLRGPRGIYRVAQDDLAQCVKKEDKCDPSVATYATVDGMPSDGLAGEGSPVGWKADDGSLWFATRTGLAVADPSHLSFNATPPPVAIERFRVDDLDVAISGEEVRVDPGHNRFLFDFAALSFTAPSKNRYRYMLDGFDRAWIEAGSSRTASYTNLPARQYTFRVQAANNDGVWNRAGASFAFRVLPPIYRRWWFYVLVLLLTGGMAIAIYRLRVHNIERRFAAVLNERNRVAREVHDTLAQDFVSVSLQLDIASALLKAKQFDGVGAQLQETRKLVKDGLEEARQSIWNLRANTAVDSLPARLTELVRRNAQTDVKLKLKMGGAYRRVSSQIEGEVFRVAQESLSNVERHANATEAALELHYDANALRLTVRDNGRGFSPDGAAQLQGHYGLRGMRERADTLNGTFTIQSEPGHGTTVSLLVALTEREGAPS